MAGKIWRGRKPGDFGIGIVGLGHVSSTHLDAYQRLGLRVVAGADIDPSLMEKAWQKW